MWMSPRGRKLFCNQVFVSEHCEEIIPKFPADAGVIDSTDIPPECLSQCLAD